MKKFNWQTGNVLQGTLQAHELRLIYLFQVNCPGCILYGLPVFNQLYHKFKNELSVFAIATSFEEFDLNNEANTLLLLREKKLVGATERIFTHFGLDCYPNEIDHPVVMDKLVSGKELATPEHVEQICQRNPNYKTWSSYDQSLLRDKVRVDMEKQEIMPYTFTLNQFAGLPSWVLVNGKDEILQQWFGRQETTTMESTIREWMTQQKGG